MRNLFFAPVIALGAIACFTAFLFGQDAGSEISRRQANEDQSKRAEEDQHGRLGTEPTHEARVIAGLAGAGNQPAVEAETESPAAEAAADIAEKVDLSIGGVLDANRLMEMLGRIADHPIEIEVDFSVVDSDYIAYSFEGMPLRPSAPTGRGATKSPHRRARSENPIL